MSGYKTAVNARPAARIFAISAADDGPAWLTLLLVGHAVVPRCWCSGDMRLFPMARHYSFVLVTLLAVYFVLPRAKGAFIALIWMTGATGQPLTANIAENDPNK